MRHEYAVGLLRDEAELERLLTVLGPIFHVSADYAPRFRRAVGDANFRIVRSGDDVAGGLALVPMGQFFGGRSVSMMGVVTVGVAPQYRARGAASALMAGVLRELHETKACALSTLYPATVPVYRRAGYEIAGGRFETTLALQDIDVRDTSLDVRPVTRDDMTEIRDLYRAVVQHHNGPLDRGDYIWNRVRSPRGEDAHGFIVREDGRCAGYVFYLVRGEMMDAKLMLTDFVAATPAAGRRLLTLLADHRSMERQAVWHGGPSPGVLMLLREASAQVRLHIPWMVRIVDVQRALTERGYPPAVNAELHLHVNDDIIDANNGTYVLRVGDGKATVEPGGDGQIRLHVRGLASLYSGHRTLADLVGLGMAEASADDAERASAVFSSPEPWMVDIF